MAIRIKRGHTVREDGTIEIRLTQDQVTVIDAEFAELANYNWAAHWCSHAKTYYAQRRIPPEVEGDNWQHLYLHRRIMELHLGRQLEKHEVPDHISFDGLDNRMSNLRLATRHHNAQHKRKYSSNKSGYIGVNWNKRDEQFYANMREGDKQRWITQSTDVLKCAFAYDQACIKSRGEFAVTNYPAAAYGLAPWPDDKESD